MADIAPAPGKIGPNNVDVLSIAPLVEKGFYGKITFTYRNGRVKSAEVTETRHADARDDER